ncbi:GcrA family cell cycle regulator [Bradyrhizobium sp.]|uniref:GcrA family cell cycle regulator n=1 Tax=Bradyrhizobium sp. TaxID=376 RepID=UPI001ECF9B74|nr:GcrA family cell cycle regulator [Bradyrhizobium sp.]MBV8917627.1 GcrA-like regulator [Bradyrhizobium sp.]MBV9981462.1 GcrA-like regulator [Bradyrhizobium sp.]
MPAQQHILQQSPSQQSPQPSSHQTWTTERVALLKSHFDAGLSCRQIAAEIGVSRNAVIGKLTRLNLTRDKKVKAPPRKAAAAVRGRGGNPAPRFRAQLIKVLTSEPEPSAADAPIHNGHTCSLYELSKEKCRWPISTPGADDFCFCGNRPVDGLPYCPGHTRLAYRVTAR